MFRSAIIVAGGSGTRMGGDTPKQFLPLAGKPMLMHSIEKFAHTGADYIVVALPEAHIPVWQKLCDEYKFAYRHSLALGGETRFHSVKNALATVPFEEGFVAVHDAARPLVTEAQICTLFDGVMKNGALVPGLALTESIREITEEGSEAKVRDNYRLIQTPQVFITTILRKAYEQEFQPAFTDCASVVENIGYRIRLADGFPGNIKITHPADMAIAEALLKMDY